jgi:hypothetical protein
VAFKDFRGDPHPTYGDAPNKMVRDAAQECMTAIFDSDTSRQAPAGAAAGTYGGNASPQPSAPTSFGGGGGSFGGSGGGSFSGGGGGSFSGGGGGSFSGGGGMGGSGGNASGFAGSGSKYGGFGNPNYAETKGSSVPLEQAVDSVKETASKALSAVSKGFSNLSDRLQQSGILSKPSQTSGGLYSGSGPGGGGGGSSSGMTYATGPNPYAPQGPSVFGGAYSAPYSFSDTSSLGESAADVAAPRMRTSTGCPPPSPRTLMTLQGVRVEARR